MPPTDSDMGPSSYAFRGISDLLMSIDLYEVRPRKDKRGVDLISDVLPFARLWYAGPGAVSTDRVTSGCPPRHPQSLERPQIPKD